MIQNSILRTKNLQFKIPVSTFWGDFWERSHCRKTFLLWKILNFKLISDFWKL